MEREINTKCFCNVYWNNESRSIFSGKTKRFHHWSPLFLNKSLGITLLSRGMIRGCYCVDIIPQLSKRSKSQISGVDKGSPSDLNFNTIFFSKVQRSLFPAEQKQAKTEEWRCHAKTIMRTKADIAQTLVMCRLGKWGIQRDKWSGTETCSRKSPEQVRSFQGQHYENQVH